MRDAGIDEAGLLDAGNDLNRMTERFARAFQKRLFAMSTSQRIRADHAHTVRTHVAQPLAESLETGDGTGCDVFVQAAVGFESGGETHHFAQTIDHDQLPVRVTGHDHVKTIGTEIDRC